MQRQQQPEQYARHIFDINPRQVPESVVNGKIASFSTGGGRACVMYHRIGHIQGLMSRQPQAEKLYCAANNGYADLAMLKRSNIMNRIPEGGRSGYQYSIDASGADHFLITAVPPDSSETVLPTFTIDETMQLSQK